MYCSYGCVCQFVCCTVELFYFILHKLQNDTAFDYTGGGKPFMNITTTKKKIFSSLFFFLFFSNSMLYPFSGFSVSVSIYIYIIFDTFFHLLLSQIAITFLLFTSLLTSFLLSLFIFFFLPWIKFLFCFFFVLLRGYPRKHYSFLVSIISLFFLLSYF